MPRCRRCGTEDEKAIPLTRGKVSIVDLDDYPNLSQFKWYVTSHNYAKATFKNKDVYMHRFLLNAPPNLHVDHINGNTLDNRRSNLRLCSRAQNMYNQKKQNRRLSSRYKGVSFRVKSNNWRAYIKYQSKYIHLGVFKTEEEAANTYNQAATKYFREYAKLNEIIREKKERDLIVQSGQLVLF